MNCNTWENITKSFIVKKRLCEGVGGGGCLSAIYCKTVVFAHIRGGIYMFAEFAARGKVDGGTLFTTFAMVF